MRIKEMKDAIENGTEVAVLNGGAGRTGVPERAARCKTVAVRRPRRVFSGARDDMTGHRADDGVRVEVLDPRENAYSGGAYAHVGRPVIRTFGSFTRPDLRDDSAPENHRVVGPRDVIGPWSVYQAALARQREATRGNENRVAAEKERAETAVRSLGVGRAVSFRLPGDFRIAGYRVELSAAEASMVADRLRYGDEGRPRLAQPEPPSGLERMGS